MAQLVRRRLDPNYDKAYLLKAQGLHPELSLEQLAYNIRREDG